RRARDEKEARDEQRAAHDRRTRLADERSERSTDCEPDEPAGVLAEEGHESEKAHPHPEPERPDVEQVAPREQEDAESDERDRQDVGGVPDDLREDARKPRPDGPAVEAEVEDRREDESEREQCEAHQLVLVLGARPLRPLLDARGDAWPK